MTKRQREILSIMAAHRHDDKGELVYERGLAYLGNDRVASRTVFAFLRMMAISLEDGEVGVGLERYRINDTGLQLLRARAD